LVYLAPHLLGVVVPGLGLITRWFLVEVCGMTFLHSRRRLRLAGVFGRLARMFSAMCCLLLSACAAMAPQPMGSIDALVGAGFVPTEPSRFVKTFLKPLPESNIGKAAPGADVRQVLNIYLEGDGAAWQFGRYPPRDPTPQSPVAARLALADKAAAAAVAYVGRPCQYLEPILLSECAPALWADERFGEKAIAMTGAAIDRLLAEFPASRRVNLVGFSGGGTLALLVAAGRADIDCVVTIASPIDIDAWADLSGFARLAGSRNPAAPAPTLSRLRQTHIYGAADRVVPVAAVGNYRNFSSESSVKIFSGNRGHSDWERFWPAIRESTCLHTSPAGGVTVLSAFRIAEGDEHVVARSEVHHE
jgi:dienelactone hydrolase